MGRVLEPSLGFSWVTASCGVKRGIITYAGTRPVSEAPHPFFSPLRDTRGKLSIPRSTRFIQFARIC